MSTNIFHILEIVNSIIEILIFAIFLSQVFQPKYSERPPYLIGYTAATVLQCSAALLIPEPYIRIAVTFILLTEKDRAVAENAIEKVSMQDYADEDFSSVSDGQRQRVMLARAICQEPEILILDEPTSYLDIHHKIQFLEILRSLAKEKHMAVILSMHELDFAEKISDYVLCIKGGKITLSGTPDKVFTAENIMGLYDIPEKLYRKYFG